MKSLNYLVNHEKKMLYQFGQTIDKIFENPNNNTNIVDDLIHHYDNVSLFEYPRILRDLSKMKPIDEILSNEQFSTKYDANDYMVVGSIFEGTEYTFGNTTIKR